MTKKLKNYIGGEWLDAYTSHYEAVPNPATGEEIAQVPLSTKEDVDKAVEVAKEAFHSWKKVPVPKRARHLFKYQQLLVEQHSELAKLITQENGKTYDDAYGEVQRGIECVEFAAGAPSLLMGDVLPDIATGIESGMYRYPVGVVGGITPFNFPMMVPCWMFPLALACGNTFVLKPSERTPLLAERLVSLASEAGWYVTGTHGDMRHMGNAIFNKRDGELDRDAHANLTSLENLVSTAHYLSPHSDIVALMVIEHQTQTQNAITWANYETRRAIHQSEIMNRALDRPS